MQMTRTIKRINGYVCTEEYPQHVEFQKSDAIRNLPPSRVTEPSIRLFDSLPYVLPNGMIRMV
jgi:hypothetical protein